MQNLRTRSGLRSGLVVLLSLIGAQSFAADPVGSCGLKGKIAARIASCARAIEKGEIDKLATREFVYLEENEVNDPLGGLDSPPLIWRLVTLKEGLEIWRNDLTTQTWMLVGPVAEGATDEKSLGERCAAVAKREKLDAGFRLPTSAELKLASRQSITTLFEKLHVSYVPAAGKGDRELLDAYKGELVADDGTKSLTQLCVLGTVAPRKPSANRL